MVSGPLLSFGSARVPPRSGELSAARDLGTLHRSVPCAVTSHVRHPEAAGREPRTWIPRALVENGSLHLRGSSVRGHTSAQGVPFPLGWKRSKDKGAEGQAQGGVLGSREQVSCSFRGATGGPGELKPRVLNPRSVAHCVCDLRGMASPPWASVSTSMKWVCTRSKVAKARGAFSKDIEWVPVAVTPGDSNREGQGPGGSLEVPGESVPEVQSRSPGPPGSPSAQRLVRNRSLPAGDVGPWPPSPPSGGTGRRGEPGWERPAAEAVTPHHAALREKGSLASACLSGIWARARACTR